MSVFSTSSTSRLEFEAVFFVGVDRLATIHPELFDKYLYVSTTRLQPISAGPRDSVGVKEDRIAALNVRNNW